MSNAVRLSLAVDADTDAAAAAFDKVGAAAKDMANDVDTAARDADSGMSGFADSADSAGSSAQTAAGAFGDLGGALAMMPGPLGAIGAGMETAAPAIQGVTGATDLLSLAMNSNIVMTVKNTAATIASTVAQKTAAAASKAMAAAQWLLNAALSANPIGIVVIAVVALIAGLVLLYQRSSAVRAIVQKLGEVAVSVFSAIVDAAKKVWAFIGNVLGPAFKVYAAIVKTQIAIVVTVIKGLWDVVKSVTDKIKAGFDAAWDKIKTLVKWDPTQTIRNAWSGIKELLTKPFTEAWEKIKSLFGSGGAVANIGDAAVTAVRNMCNDVIDLINKLISAFNKLPGPNIPSIPHVSSSAASRTVGTARSTGGVGATRVAGLSAAGSAGAAVQINIYGAVDTYGTAQQIRRILARAGHISGRVTP